MCGIAGLAGFRDDALLRAMCERMLHRGPDDHGVFPTDTISLGMRRLAVIDLAGGHQPMTAENDRVALVFNGEIYNHGELRKELEGSGFSFATRCDTEVILHGYRKWGVSVLDRLNGMFTIALLDRRGEPELHVARDRVGIKPLYYRFEGGRLTFANELKALLLDDRLDRTLNARALHWYLKLRFVPGAETLFKEVHKLQPGHRMHWKDGRLTLHRYWEPRFDEQRLSGSDEELAERVQAELDRSVRLRLQADVPVGAYLSGGLDSSVLTALMARHHGGTVNTFSIGFGYEEDETSDAAATARVLGTTHHEVTCRDEDFGALDSIAWQLDEPVGDAIVLPLYLLAKEARKHVTVVLSGEGADEIFGGYLFHKVLRLTELWRRVMPGPLRALGRGLFGLAPHALINQAFSYPADLGADGKAKMLQFLNVIEAGDINASFRFLITLFSEGELDGAYHRDFASALNQQADYLEDAPAPAGTLNRILQASLTHWLPDVILMKLDKMTMAHSLEGRVPYMDHELMALAHRLPDRCKVRGWTDKWILRKIGEELLPRATARRGKKPFFIPTHAYFNRPTFERLFEQFRESKAWEGLLDPAFVAGQNLAQTSLLRSKQLFSLMMLDSWLRQYVHAPSAARA